MNDNRQNDLSRYYETTNKDANDRAALISRLNLLKMTAHKYNLGSIEYEINRILKSLQVNNPKQKILNSVARRIDTLAAQIQLIEQRRNQRIR